MNIWKTWLLTILLFIISLFIISLSQYLTTILFIDNFTPPNKLGDEIFRRLNLLFLGPFIRTVSAFWLEGSLNLLNPILYIDPVYRLVLIWAARRTLGSGVNFAAVQIPIIGTLVLILVLSPIFITLKSREITYYLYLLSSYTLPALSLIPFVLIRLMSYQSFGQALLKSIIPLLLVGFLIVPAITLAFHSEELKTKHQLNLLSQPAYLTGGMGKIGERVGTNRVEWSYNILDPIIQTPC